MVDVCDAAMIWLPTKGYTWLGVNDVQALLRKVKQRFETNKERLMFIKSERSRSFGLECDLLYQ
jgi:hypothetical protein